MKLSKIDRDQMFKIAKAALYVGVSAMLDYLISMTSGTQFGVLTPLINVVLVTIKQAFTPSK